MIVERRDAVENMARAGLCRRVIGEALGRPIAPGMRDVEAEREAARRGVEVRAFEWDGWVGARPAGASDWPHGFGLARALDRVTDVVVVPRASAHLWCGYTMAVKSWVAICRPADRIRFHWAGGFAPGAAAQIAQLSLAVADRVRLVVLEASRALGNFGPNFGPVVEPGLLVVARDLVSADVAGLAAMKLAYARAPARARAARIAERGPWAQDMVRAAIAAGLGPEGPGALRVSLDARMAPDERATLLRHMGDATVEGMPI